MRRVPALILCALLLGAACGNGGHADEGRNPSAPIVEGSASRLRSSIRSMRPRPVVVNYWATWCEPCKEEMPRLVSSARRYRGRVGFLGVNVEDDLVAARAFAGRYGIPFRSIAMSKREVQEEFEILGLPVTQFYGADGELALVHQGEISARDLEEKIEDLLRIGRPVGKP